LVGALSFFLLVVLPFGWGKQQRLFCKKNRTVAKNKKKTPVERNAHK
jgi:hypothetical protein